MNEKNKTSIEETLKNFFYKEYLKKDGEVCPELTEIAEYIDGNSAKDDVRRIESHAAACNRCAELIADSTLAVRKDRKADEEVSFDFRDIIESGVRDEVRETVYRGEGETPAIPWTGNKEEMAQNIAEVTDGKISEEDALEIAGIMKEVIPDVDSPLKIKEDLQDKLTRLFEDLIDEKLAENG